MSDIILRIYLYTCSLLLLYCYTGVAGPDPFSGLIDDGKIAVASSVTFIIGSSMFFIIGFLCRHFCQKFKERHSTANTQTSTGVLVPGPLVSLIKGISQALPSMMMWC